MRLEGTYCTAHRLPGARIPSQTSWSWPCLLLPQPWLAYLKCFAEKHVRRVLVKQRGDGVRTHVLGLVKSAAICVGCPLGVLSWPGHYAERGWKCPSFTAHQKTDIVIHLQGGVMKVAALGRGRNMAVIMVPWNESCSFYDTFKKVEVPWKSYRSSIWLLVQSFFLSLGLLSVWMSQRGSPLELHSKPDKMRDRWSPRTDSTSANVHMHKVSAPTKEARRSIKPSLDNLFED